MWPYTHGFETRTGPAGRTVVIGNRPPFRFFKLPKPEILNFQWTFRPAIKPPGFQNRARVRRFPKNHKTNIAHNNLQHQIFPEKEKKKKKRKRIEDYGRKATNLLLDSAYASTSVSASASAYASSLFVEKWWKETVVCLKTVEEIIEVERGGGCWESKKNRRQRSIRFEVWSCGVASGNV